MGRRSINTTKSGKFMNPTDQARKEARKRELKKNKRQRMTVRHAVLKSKDPMKILEEIELIDQIEFDPMNPPLLNEKVLKDKRKKLKETFYRVLKLYEKEDPEYSSELRKSDVEQDRRREKLQIYYEQVKNTERVQIDQIPLPDVIVQPEETGMIPLPDDLPTSLKTPGRGILKHTSLYGSGDGDDLAIPDDADTSDLRSAPPGPPPGSPTPLSDSEDEEYDPAKDIEENLGVVDIDVEHPHAGGHVPPEPDELPEPREPHEPHEPHEPQSKQRKIRFADDNDRDESAPEKDTRIKFKPRAAPITALQARMLQMAGQALPAPELVVPVVPVVPVTSSISQPTPTDADMPPSPPPLPKSQEKHESSSEEDSPDEDDDDDDKSDDSDANEDDRENSDVRLSNEKGDKGDDEDSSDDEESELVPPGPPPGMPPNMMLPPGVTGPPMPLMGIITRPVQPGPMRPVGLPPGPPPGLPPGVRGIMPRMPPGMPPAPPMRMMRPPGGPMSIPPPNIPLPPGLGPPVQHPSVLSAPPSIMKPAQTSGGGGGGGTSDERLRSTATIEAKPQIKNVVGDVTRFMPTALKVKRQIRDSKGRLRHIGKEEEKVSAPTPKHASKAAPQTKTKDHAYEAFMKEMSGLM